MKRTCWIFYRYLFAIIFGIGLLLLVSGCQSKYLLLNSSSSYRATYNSFATAENSISPETKNILSNYLLLERFPNNPKKILNALESIYKKEPRKELLAALADVAYQESKKVKANSLKAVAFQLSSLFYAYLFLAQKQDEVDFYAIDNIRMLNIYNIALTEVFEYINANNLQNKKNLNFISATGRVFNFNSFKTNLPVNWPDIKEIKLCADYKVEKLNHDSRSLGIGVPLIVALKDSAGQKLGIKFAQNQTLSATALVFLKDVNSNLLNQKSIDVHSEFFNPRKTDSIKIGDNTFTLYRDFSTPLAYMAKDPLPFGLLTYMLNPTKTTVMQGLYHFEEPDDERIPVVFVHGLMSDTRTWLQMINTLRNDKVIRKRYQFWGFSYSSGNPIFYSAYLLRKALLEEEARLKKNNKSTKAFNQMVLIGHSMGGLLSRISVSNSSDILEEAIGKDLLNKAILSMDKEQQLEVRNILSFKPLPFVKRVVFIAVPHKGSMLAKSFIGRLGAKMIELPKNLITYQKILLNQLFKNTKLLKNSVKISTATGIDNLAPDNMSLKIIDKLPIKENLPYHSIIGNKDYDSNNPKKDLSKASDGIVPYTSSHLPNAVSEVIVKSNHSVHRNALAIEETRRILLLHLK